jgi:SAM-dependent methyltransferase
VAPRPAVRARAGGEAVMAGYEKHAAAWAAWARTPGHDAYTRYRDAFFALVPPPGRATLEIGCGEGRVTRDLRARGHHVVAVDVSPTLVALAREADPGGEYAVADAAALPFADRAFDLVVAFNSLMDMDDLEGAVREAARVLEPGGRLCASTTHPLSDAGAFREREPGPPFVIEGSYFGRRPVEIHDERNGLAMTFVGWAFPLETFTRALEDAGLAIEALREPRPPDDEPDPRYERWRRIPMFLQLRALKP